MTSTRINRTPRGSVELSSRPTFEPIMEQKDAAKSAASILMENNLWSYLAGAIIVIVIIMVLSRTKSAQDWYNSLNFQGITWVKSSGGKAFCATYMLVALFLGAYAVSRVVGHHASRGDSMKANMACILAVILGGLLASNAFALYSYRNFDLSFYIHLIALCVCVVATYLFWSVDASAGYCMFGLTSFIVVSTFVSYSLRNNNRV